MIYSQVLPSIQPQTLSLQANQQTEISKKRLISSELLISVLNDIYSIYEISFFEYILICHNMNPEVSSNSSLEELTDKRTLFEID